jgi:hypothetical protein
MRMLIATTPRSRRRNLRNPSHRTTRDPPRPRRESVKPRSHDRTKRTCRYLFRRDLLVSSADEALQVSLVTSMSVLPHRFRGVYALGSWTLKLDLQTRPSSWTLKLDLQAEPSSQTPKPDLQARPPSRTSRPRPPSQTSKPDPPSQTSEPGLQPDFHARTLDLTLFHGSYTGVVPYS